MPVAVSLSMDTDTTERPTVPYPVTLSVVVSHDNRNRVTTAFRPVLALPHALLVGPIGWTKYGSSGLLGAAAYLLAIVNWFALILTEHDLKGVREFQLYYLRWRTRAVAYMALFADTYPPFGDGPYPASIEVSEPPAPRDRLTIGLRLLLALPHLVVLCFVLLGWLVTTVIAWFAILFTGAYPEGLSPFGVGAMRWLLRVEAYMLLLVDEYPPFTLD